MSLLNAVSAGNDVVRAVKVAEDGRGLVVRLFGTAGLPPEGVDLKAIVPIRGVRELRGDEVEIPTGSDVRLDDDGVLHLRLLPSAARAFALDLVPAAADRRLASADEHPARPPLEPRRHRPRRRPGRRRLRRRRALSAECPHPEEFVRDGVAFRTGPRGPGQANLVACRGQKIPVPKGKRVQVLACAITPDGQGCVGDVPDGRGWFGQWDSRVVGDEIVNDPDEITPAYVHEADLGRIVTHRRAADGTVESYTYTTFYRFDGAPFEVSGGVLKLPDDPRLIVLAATATDDLNGHVRPATPLLDQPNRPSLTLRSDAAEVLRPRRRRDRDAEPARDDPLHARRQHADRNVARVCGPAPDHGVGDADRDRRRRRLRRDHDARAPIFTKVAPRPAPADAPQGDLPHGLNVRCYEGVWDKLPDFDALTPTATLSGEPVGIPARMRDEDIGLAFDGWLAIPRDGMYRLFLASDDGSRLHLDGELALDDDGLHGAAEYAYDAPLAAGLHRVRLDFFQHLGGRELSLEWSGPGFGRQEVPASAFVH